MTDPKLRAWWWHRQGLDGSLRGKTPRAVLERTGWARSVGGVGPYLTLFSRAGTTREAADAAVAKLEIHELPTARGCTYVLPSTDFALGLSVGQEFGGGEMKTAAKLGVTEKEIEKLCDAILAALDKSGAPLDPAFRWVGPATLKEFQWFSGLGVKASKQAVEPLGLTPIAGDSDRLLFPDAETASIVWASFGLKKSKALEAAVEETEAFVRDQLGDARSFSLDSPKGRRPRIEAIRGMR